MALAKKQTERKNNIELCKTGRGLSIFPSGNSVKFNLGELDERVKDLQVKNRGFIPIIDMTSEPIQVYDKRDLEVDSTSKDQQSSENCVFIYVYPSEKESGRLLMNYTCLKKEVTGHFPDNCRLSEITVTIANYQKDNVKMLAAWRSRKL